ncbi:MAG: ABC transporter ATP-binding protein [Desulforhabdus sp.]|jgi:lipopolysaccharide transport system ATP-binding protein|nr:ABC transporter ATP-binding protein [Desulforhabdus sp.]
MITVSDLYKTFKLYRSPADRLKEIVTRRKYCQEFSALKGISFEVQAGETLGVVGQNGAGKSTLLKILAGVLLPDSGSVEINGKITGLLELGTGFNSEFSGLQNIYLNGTLLGMRKEEIRAKLDQIVAFTELDAFIERPLKTYSSGMVMRLAFAIAIHADPQAFVVDEALSVGDAYFQQKCMDRIKQFKQQGGSIIFVSHDMNAVKVICDNALLLDHGFVVEQGTPDRVIDTYNFLLAKKSKGEEVRFQPHASGEARSYGNFKVQIAEVHLLNELGEPAEHFVSGAACTMTMILKANENVDDLTVGILIRDRFGQDIFGTNTHHLNLPISLKNGEKCQVKYLIRELNLGPGKYTLTVAAHKSETHIQDCYQWIDVMKTFEVTRSSDFAFVGLSKLKPDVNIKTL